jgi:hypothetical protein
MTQPIGIIIAGALIAIAIMLTNLGRSSRLAPTLQMNRWTGSIAFCSSQAGGIGGGDVQSMN